MPQPFRVPIHQLLMGRNPPAGMNHLLLMHLVYDLRSTAEDHDPIRIAPVSDSVPCFRITDGRHRAMAALIAGRPDVLAVLEHEPECPPEDGHFSHG